MEDVVFDREWFEKTDEMNRDMYYMVLGILPEVILFLRLSNPATFSMTLQESLPECSGRSILKPLATTILKFREQTSPILRFTQVLEASATYLRKKVEPGEEEIVLDVAVIKAEKGDLVLFTRIRARNNKYL
jgi:glucose-6-phosphate isomerase